MKLEIEVTLRLHPDVATMLAALVDKLTHPVVSVVVPAGTTPPPAEIVAPTAAEPAPVKRGPGRPRKDAAQPAPAPVETAPAPTEPAPANPLPVPPQATAPNVPSGPDLTTIARRMAAVMKLPGVGVPPVKALLVKFGVAALPELKSGQYVPFAAELEALAAKAGG